MSGHKHIQQMDIDGAAAEIARMAASGGITAIAIAGSPGSGKSTMAARLCSELCSRLGPVCCVVPMDGFHLDNDTLSARGLLSVKGAPETFDLEGFSVLVAALKSGVARHFPTFDRDRDSVVENGGCLPDGASILLFEGNYLLLGENGWSDLADMWDASIWLEVPMDVLEERLTRRWLDQGMSPEDASARARGNDLVNARRVIENSRPATWVMDN